MKITILGCEPRCLFLAKAIAQNADELDIEKLSLVDPDADRRAVYGGMAEKICRLLHARLRFQCTESLVEGLIGADYIVSLRTPDEAAAAEEEARLCAEADVSSRGRFGALTLLRTARIVRQIEAWYEFAKKYSKPEVRILNLISPCGAVMQTLRARGLTNVFSPGLAAAAAVKRLARILRTDPEAIRGRCTGLSYLCVCEIPSVGGKEILPALLENDAARGSTAGAALPAEMLRRKEILPDGIFTGFLNGGVVPPDQARLADAAAEDALTQKLAQTDLANRFDDALRVFSSFLSEREKTDGARTEADVYLVSDFSPFDRTNALFAEEILGFLRGVSSPARRLQYLLVPNGGVYPQFSPEDVIVLPCELSRNGIFARKDPVRDGDCLELLRRLKRSERSLCAAVAAGDSALAEDALAFFPGIDSYKTAAALVRDCKFLQEGSK